MHHHAHAHHHDHAHDRGKAAENISAAFFLNAFFVVVEAVGGWATNSVAILSDALHDFGDCLSLATAWFLARKAEKPRDARYSYGYRRFSLLGAVFLSGVLTVSSAFMVVEAVRRLLAPQPVAARGMLWIAVFGVVVNGAAALRAGRGASLNERAVFLHLMEDVLGWVAVLAAAGVMLVVDFPALDPILSLAIALWVLVNVARNLRSVFRVLLQAVPEGVDPEAVKTRLLALDGVESVHDLHLWSLDGESHVMTLHVVTRASDLQAVKRAVVEVVRRDGVGHVTIEFERPGTVCTTDCDSAAR
ncbi:MAG: cation transporter [Kiritimatiellae bacterium]|nr:cation transporter [Kiritimatiellia bacterium]